MTLHSYGPSNDAQPYTGRGVGGDVAGSMAAFFHDVRTPLTALQMVIDALEDGVIDESLLPDHLRRLRLLVERLAILTGDLIPGDEPAPRTAVSISGLLADAIAIARPASDLAGVELRLELDEEALRAWADPAAVARALDNIVDNAIRHTARGEAVTLSAWQDEEGVCLGVVDGCGGIPTAEVDLIFGPNYQSTGPAGEAGLGLAIARELVEHQDGSIGVHNLEVGCRFEIRLPPVSAPS